MENGFIALILWPLTALAQHHGDLDNIVRNSAQYGLILHRTIVNPLQDAITPVDHICGLANGQEPFKFGRRANQNDVVTFLDPCTSFLHVFATE